MKQLTWSFVLLLVTAVNTAAADVLVLVHGYLGSAQSWAEAGVLDRLQQRGYRPVAMYGYGAGGVLRLPLGSAEAKRPIYTVNLPSQAPIAIQADWLAAYLRDVRKQHPDEPIVLAAHSAGGLVARMTLVRHGRMGVSHLITIATPHFGTGRAIQALDATDRGGMFGFVKSWLVRRKTGDALYATVQQSRGVLFDLAPPAPGNMLFWLNQQPHPKIRYTAIMRTGTFQMPGDQVVPPMSQDLNRVPALAGQVKTYQMAQGHLLTPQDGDLIGNLLAMDRATKAQR
ncbi:MAG: alpha/beta fold hydrolase [Gammaproteobacteria bacterium]|nr:alpha/beta fold hydrolase [Gammaproteobacteria bacterium]